MSAVRTILHINSSARMSGSASRALSQALVDRIKSHVGERVVIKTRDVGATQPPSFVNEQWIGASFTPEENRTDAQRETLRESDGLIEELRSSDVVVVGAAMYNFGVPAALKAYFDQVARAGVTFKYNDQGVPEGLLKGKKAFIVVTSGGVPMNASGMDFMTPHVVTFLGLLGITDVSVIDASSQMKRDDANDVAKAAIDAIDLDAVLA
ncbi:NADH-azoreductase, FMN-dependent [Ostreococcus tauri]|uniref:FMN-dependent NADH-azoreductase n=1 Tax=Ostreococcus tauri TaxID=70448 RepID=A0A090M496_OSTTA|nr:NADH-azoreductase, FMN-dependent [Ostreococcus tauri]CEF97492.1 NADH-azoreductase, FMN-dependent [Ostreococcus tauri]|eukprot:XP_003075090.2 NADH-azoreductase, FMN-dependent [Ostreococcus tauri]